MENHLILGIETSCDETAVAIVENGKKIISNVVASQIDSHKRFGGVVPEVASRHHVENITIVIEEAFQKANLTWDDIDAIAVTQGPGLIGALLIGVNAAKALAFAKKDRKSTRLNSSHVANSYAVSCLNKKKMQQISG